MGTITEPVLKLCGFQTAIGSTTRSDVEPIVDRGLPHGLRRRQLPGRDPAVAAHGRPHQAEGPLTVDRRRFVSPLLAEPRRACWSSPASARRPMTWPLAATIARNFYIWSGLGCTPTVGLGLALARPDRRVAVITGDGDVLMALGSLATIGVKQPRNLSIVCLDNGHYSATGMQPSATKAGVDLGAAARPASCASRWFPICRAPTSCASCCIRGGSVLHPRPRRCRRSEAHHPEPRRRRDQASLHAGGGDTVDRALSITSSARASKFGGMSSPSDLAVLRLITISYWSAVPPEDHRASRPSECGRHTRRAGSDL